MMWSVTLTAVVILAILFQLSMDCPKPCPQPLDEDAKLIAHPECAFVNSYVYSRSLFRANARRAGANELFALNVTKDDLTIDIAVFRGSSKSLLLHISGTHGTEGFIGSGIQNGILEELRNGTSHIKPAPTIVLVHALNPYGMAHWRRWNEDGIDLNRNALFKEEDWSMVLSRDSNIAGYNEIDDLLNPQGPPSWLRFVSQVFATSWKLIAKGHWDIGRFIKKALVTGTYTSEKGIYYGGKGLATSHKLLSKWLHNQGFLQSVKHLAIIDVHSGLGAEGQDTLLAYAKDADRITNIFAGETSNFRYTRVKPSVEVSFKDKEGISQLQSGEISEGFELQLGDVIENYPKIFNQLEESNCIFVTQEFGTVSGIQVLAALVLENQAHWYSSKRTTPHNKWNQMLFDAFNVDKQHFKKHVLERGLEVFFQTLETLNHPQNQ